MINVGRALVRMHQDSPALRALDTGGNKLVVCLLTDKEASGAVFPRAVLAVTLGPSETRAAVPFVCTETIRCADGADSALPTIGNAVLGALNGKHRILDRDAMIHWLLCRSAALEDGGYGIVQVRIEWEGRASWR